MPENSLKSQQQTSSRKQQHVELCVDENVIFKGKTAGFEKFDFQHNALPEIDYAEISTATIFIKKRIAFPLMISCMTGGYPDAERINAGLAAACEVFTIPMGVGSQRQAMENTRHHESFKTVRRNAPTIPIIGNIGAAEVAQRPSVESFKRIIDLIEADALAVHLNPLQELLQPEGTPSFKNVLTGIENLVRTAGIPIIVKEVGAGISGDAAKKLLNIGVAAIDVAGAGGTSWAGVELLRNEERNGLEEFWDWGIPTVECLLQIAPLKKEQDFTLIASGGVSSGVDMAKSIALGADLAAAARIFLKTFMDSGADALHRQIALWQKQFRYVMFLTGSADITALKKAPISAQ
ncbi:MAG TPA: type 2 isopentenyl-diphosphate Delta-isomerase [Patescibacteria group bacterium]|nr:type 2 isopentenyl-diphosphate Delta-isomerase [Patescibacteria group bacterium]